jgi:hypothetical protein
MMMMNMNMMSAYGASDVLFNVRLVGSDSQCGVPGCCPGHAAHLDLPKGMLPQQLQGKMGLHELEPFAAEVQKILDETCCPMFPMVCMHFCIPLSPICCVFYWAGQRQKRLQVVIEKVNDQLRSKGYYWTMGSTGAGGGRNAVPGMAFLMFKTTNAHEMLNPQQAQQQSQQQVNAQAQQQVNAQAQQVLGAMGGVGMPMDRNNIGGGVGGY